MYIYNRARALWVEKGSCAGLAGCCRRQPSPSSPTYPPSTPRRLTSRTDAKQKHLPVPKAKAKDRSPRTIATFSHAPTSTQTTMISERTSRLSAAVTHSTPAAIDGNAKSRAPTCVALCIRCLRLRRSKKVRQLICTPCLGRTPRTGTASHRPSQQQIPHSRCPNWTFVFI